MIFVTGSVRTFPIGVQEAVESRLHADARDDVGDGNALDPTATRLEQPGATRGCVGDFHFPGRLTRPMRSFGSKRLTACRLDASPPSEAAIY